MRIPEDVLRKAFGGDAAKDTEAEAKREFDGHGISMADHQPLEAPPSCDITFTMRGGDGTSDTPRALSIKDVNACLIIAPGNPKSFGAEKPEFVEQAEDAGMETVGFIVQSVGNQSHAVAMGAAHMACLASAGLLEETFMMFKSQQLLNRLFSKGNRPDDRDRHDA